MADLLPSDPPEEDTPVVGLDSDDADELLDVLSSETARSVLAALQEDPATPSEVADRVDTSLQNAQYHLENLQDAEVIEVVDTATSEKGREMDVYAATGEPLVVLAGNQNEAGTIRRALARFLGGVALVAGASLLVQVLLGSEPRGPSIATTTEPSGGLPPGLVFFAGGLLALIAVLAVWVVRDR